MTILDNIRLGVAGFFLILPVYVILHSHTDIWSMAALVAYCVNYSIASIFVRDWWVIQTKKLEEEDAKNNIAG